MSPQTTNETSESAPEARAAHRLRDFELALQHITANQEGRIADSEIIASTREATGAIGVALVKSFDASTFRVSSGRLAPRWTEPIKQACLTTKQQKSITLSNNLKDCKLLCIPLLSSASCTSIVMILENEADVQKAISFGTISVTYLRLCFHRERDELDRLDSQIQELIDLEEFVRAPDRMRIGCDEATKRLKQELNCRFVAICEPAGSRLYVTSVCGLHHLEPSSPVQVMISQVAEEARDSRESGHFQSRDSAQHPWQAHALLCKSMRCEHVASHPIYNSGQLVAVVVWAADPIHGFELQQQKVAEFSHGIDGEFWATASSERLRWLRAASELRELLGEQLHWDRIFETSEEEQSADLQLLET
ncbi:MAG: hypothetical protein AAF483_12105 [Planctomycetota bacterium]